MTPDFNAQHMRHNLYPYLPTSTTDAAKRAAQDADRAFRLLWIAIFETEFYFTAPFHDIEERAKSVW